MVRYDCLNYDGDEDCHKCCKHGFIFGCECCDDFEDFCSGLRGDEHDK